MIEEEDDNKFFRAIENPIQYVEDQMERGVFPEELIIRFKKYAYSTESKGLIFKFLAYLFFNIELQKNMISNLVGWNDSTMEEMESMDKRMAFIEKDVTKLKRILKRLDKTTK